MTKLRQAYPTDLNDTEWAVLLPYLPAPSPVGRPRTHAWRDILDAMFYVVRSGCAWRLLPHEFPAWKTVYSYFRAWRLNGFWQQLNTVLRRALRVTVQRQPDPSAMIMDSQTVRTVEGGEERGYDAGKTAAGRKRHILVDTLGLRVFVLVTAADLQDRDGAKRLLRALYQQPLWQRVQLLWADGGYRGALAAWVQRLFGWRLEIVATPNGATTFQVQPKRWIVERTFAWLNRHRRKACTFVSVVAAIGPEATRSRGEEYTIAARRSTPEYLAGTSVPLQGVVRFKRYIPNHSLVPILANIRTEAPMVRTFFAREDGQGLVEYALILVLIAIVVIGILSILGKRVSTVFSQINSGLSN